MIIVVVTLRTGISNRNNNTNSTLLLIIITITIRIRITTANILQVISVNCSADPRTEIRKLSLPVAASLSNLGGSLHAHVSARVPPQMGLYKVRQGFTEVCPI